MKKLLLASASVLAMGVVSASAADLPARMPAKAPAYVAPMTYNWTGFYLGLNGGYGFGRS
jgi:outer membrane immunogenic protein